MPGPGQPDGPAAASVDPVAWRRWSRRVQLLARLRTARTAGGRVSAIGRLVNADADLPRYQLDWQAMGILRADC